MHQNLNPLYIFDIDGTLCNIEHRLHFLENKADPQRWTKFYEACVDDIPNAPVIAVLQHLMSADLPNEIWLFSGRNDTVRQQTIEWLHKYTPFSMGQLEMYPELLTMRPEGDYTEDHLMKQDWLHHMLQEDRDRLVCVFDDRKRVVDMWRANGVPCFQVAAGEF
jgi:FMN phosphatase YigB (HAD superfamily)